MNAQTHTLAKSLQPRHSGAGRNPVETIPFPPCGNALRGRHAKAPAFRLTPLTALIQATLLSLPATTMAGPEGGVVAAGTGTIARPNAQTTNIHQSSQNLILNWDSYNIRANETVNYRQPNANAQALNRIHSQNPSHIYGQLNANGQVLLVNPNGVFFKPGARVNVGGLVASGLNITDQDFLAGKYRFKHAGDTPPGAVVNQGVIQAATGGSVSLIGGAVKNEGRILAHAGQVNLVAGRAMAMDFDGDGLMRFTVSEALLKKTEGLEQAVSNTGTIEAEGGAVLLQGRAARDVFSEVVNNSGVIGAAKVDNTGGVIRLVAAGRGNSLLNTGTLKAAGGAIKLKAEGKVEVSGKASISTASKTGKGGHIDITGQQVRITGQARLDASSAAPAGQAGGTIKLKAQDKAIVTGKARITATSKTGKGGQIQITGNKVGLFGEARLDASGATGGGQILTGGDYQGKNPAIKNAKVTYIGKGAKLAADATQKGQGGRVIVWADDTTRYHGQISAKGGQAGGDGGFVEVSGKRHLAFRGKVDVSAAKGRAGTLLLDPNNLCIGGRITCGSTTPEDTSNPFDAASSEQDSWVSEATLKNIGDADIILQANNNIYFDGNINLGTSYTSDFRLLAGSSIDMQGHRLTLQNGTARFYAGSTVVEKRGEFTTTIERSGNITLGPVTANTLYLSAGNVNAEGALTVTNLRLNEARPARTGSTGIFAKSRGYTGQYTITAGGLLNAITKLYVGGTLGDKLHLITLEGYEIASPIKTGAKTTLTFEMRGVDHDHGHATGEGDGDHHDDEFTITQAEGAVISGPGKLVKGGTGTLELSQANTYSGDTEVSGGALRLTHADGLGTPAKKDGKTPASKTTLTSAGATLELDGHAGGLEINLSESLILNGGILRNESGANTWHGPVTLGKANTIDSEAGALTINSALSLQSGTGSASKAEDLQITGAGDVTLTGVISGKGGIIKGRAGRAGAGDTGTLTLSGANTYTGRTTVNHGVLRIQHNNALGTGTGSLGTTVNANGTLALYATGTASLNIGNEALMLAGGTLKNAQGDNTWNGNISLTAAATIDSRTRVVKFTRDGIEGEIHYQQTLTLAGNISGAHDLTFTGGGHTDMRGQIQTGTGKLTKTGAGTLTLNNSNTYTGDTTVSGGTLALGGTRTNPLDATGDLIVENNAIFALGQANQTFANVTLRAGQITRLPGALASRGVLTVSASGQIQAQSGAISANLAGGAPLTKTTDGWLTLSGDNRGYTGAVTITAGILRLFGGHALDDEAEVSLNSATDNNTARLDIATSQTLGSLTGRGQVYIGPGQTLTLNIGAGETASYAGFIFGAAPLSRTLFRDGRLVTETIQGGLTKTGAGTLTLKGANTFGGQTRINQGKLRIEHLLALQNTAVHLADAANTQLTVATASLSKERTRIGSLSGGAAADATGAARDNGKIVIFKGQVLAINQTTDGIYSGRITQVTPDPLPQIFIDEPRLPRPSAADLIKTGPARLTLSGKNAYTGLTLINEGTLAIGQDDAINSASALIVGQPPRFDFARIRLIDPVEGVFDLGTHNQTFSRVQLNAGAINRSGATGSNQGVLTVNSLIGESGPLIGFTLMSGTVNAILAGRTSLLKDNPFVSLIINRYSYALYIESSVTLNAANTYSGKTTISKGTLRITDAGALGTAANDDATGTTIESGDFLRFCLRRVECGVSRHGGGTLELDLGAGNHRIENENLILAGQGAFDTKNLDITRETVARHIVGVFDAKGALRNVSGNNTWGGGVELEGDATIQNDSGDPSAAAPSLTLGSDLRLTHHDEDERADLTVTGPGKTLFSGRIRGLGGLIKRGAGTLVLNRAQADTANDYSGGTEIKAGTLELQGGYAIPDDGALNKGVTLSKSAILRVTASETLGSLRDDPANGEDPGGKVEIVKGQTLTLNNASGNDTAFSGVISEVNPASGASTDRAKLTKKGAGKFTLAGQNTYTGETKIEDGALKLGRAGAINAGGRLLVSGADAVFDLAGYNNTFAGVKLEAGTIDDSGRLVTGETARQKGALTLSTGDYDLQNGRVNAVLAGGSGVGLQKNAVNATTPGTVILSAANTYSGQTTINAGTLAIAHSNALGGTGATSGTTVNSGATLELQSRLTRNEAREITAQAPLNVAEPLTLAGGTLRNLHGFNKWSGPITLAGNSIIDSHRDADTVVKTLPPTTNCPAPCQVKGLPGSLTITGVIGSATDQTTGFTKTGQSGLLLTGASANTYRGLTTVAQGALIVGKDSALGATGANAGTVVYKGATLLLQGGARDPSTAGPDNPLGTLVGPANLNISGERLTLAGGLLASSRGNNTWGGAINLASETTYNAGGSPTIGTTAAISHIAALIGQLTVSGNISLVSGTGDAALAHTLQITTTPAFVRTPAGSVTITGVISGAGGNLSKTGAGRLTLKGANTFSGQTRINQGTLRIEHLLALQNSAVHIADAANTQLTVATEPDMASFFSKKPARIGSLSGGGRIVIFKDQVLAINQTTDGIYSGRIMEQDPVPLPAIFRQFFWLKPRPAELIKTGAARLTLSGKNTYTGITRINQGTLAIGQNDAIHSASSLIVGQAPRYDYVNARLIDPIEGVFDLGAYNQTFSGVRLNAGAINRTGASGSNQGVLTVNSARGQVFTLMSGTVNAILAGRTGLLKDNLSVRVIIDRRRFPVYIESAVTLNAANTYSGKTTIRRGTLRITNAGALGTAANDDATGTTIEAGGRRRLHIARYGFTRHGGGTLELDLGAGRNHSIDNENLILNGQGAFDTKDSNITRATLDRHVQGRFDARGALRNTSGNNTWGGAVRLASNSTISGTGSLTFGGAIDGAHDLTLDGALIARFSGALGGTRPLRNLTVNGAQQIILTGALTLTGRATFSNITGVEEAGRRVAIKMREGEGSPGSLTAKALLLQDITDRSQLRGDVDTVAANNIGAFSFTDTDDLTIGTVGTVRGITTSNPLTLDVSGLLQSGPAGEAIAASSTLTLKARGIGRADTPLNLNFTGTAAGSLSVTTSGQDAAGNIYLSNQGNLNTSVLNFNTNNATAQTVQLSVRRHSGAGRNPVTATAGAAGPFLIVDDPDAGSSNLDANDTLVFNTATRLDTEVNTTIRALTFASQVTATAARTVNTGRGALTFQGMINADTNRLTLTAARLTLTDDITAGALDMSGAGELVIAGNSPTLIVDPVNITFANLMTGEGALTIPGIQGQNLDVGEDLKLPTNMRGYRGHLIIGGRLTREGALPWYSPDVTQIQVHVPRLTVSRAIETGGPVTLLAGDLDLNADIQTGGQLGLVAIGPNQPGLLGSTGLIRAGGQVRLTVPPSGVAAGRPAAAIIAVGGFRNAFDINLRLGRRELDLASSQGSVGFDPRSRFTDQITDPDFRAFVSRIGAVLGTSRPLGLQLAQAFAFNPASRLTGTEALTFIDLSLFGQELTLFGAIGTGIALSLSQCEAQYGCAPNVTLEELDTLIAQLTARIAELERRLLAADESERATIEAQLAGYRAERQNFEAYRETLKRYILAEEEAESLPVLPEAGDTDEVLRLTRALQGVRARIQWLEGLRGDAAERERLARATGQDLTPARLEVIIEAAKAQATFMENRIRLLLEGMEAALPEAPEFRAEAGDYESVDVVQYGESLGALTLGVERGWY